jgi:hypothetical protein
MGCNDRGDGVKAFLTGYSNDGCERRDCRAARRPLAMTEGGGPADLAIFSVYAVYADTRPGGNDYNTAGRAGGRVNSEGGRAK